MNHALILAGGTGQRMRTKGMPKQFLEASGKPIIIHTLELFEEAECIDDIVVPCNVEWIGHMKALVDRYGLKKVISVIPGGSDRQGSIIAGVNELVCRGAQSEDVVVIHDGVRPLVEIETLNKNCDTATMYGCAVTARENTEGVVVVDGVIIKKDNFVEREKTYTLTSPQSFKFNVLRSVYQKAEMMGMEHMLDTALLCAELGDSLRLVVEGPGNIKITTPDDFYYFKARLELEESKRIWGM